jgi:hypothetical protein
MQRTALRAAADTARWSSMSIRVLLIILIVLSWVGGITSIMSLSTTAGRVRWDMVIWAVIIFAANSFCARYLYRKAETRKTEWALFGFLGNTSALFVYWLVKDITSHWSRGKRYFG